jgi:hypothetical protein
MQSPQINAGTSCQEQGLQLVDIVDFKWLMAGAGHHVHVERLQQDPEYAARCLAAAEDAPVPALRAAAQRLRTALQQRNR